MPSRVKYFHAVIDDQNAQDAVLGGRSMGARAAVVAMNESGRQDGGTGSRELSFDWNEQRVAGPRSCLILMKGWKSCS